MARECGDDIGWLCRDKLRLPPDVLAALESRTRDHVLTASGFFPCSIDREYLYGYAADGYRSPLWLCAAYNGSPALVHRHRGHKVFFHVGIQDRQLVVIPGIHYFDAHRLQPDLLDTLDRQFDPGSMKFASPEGAGDTVNDPSRMRTQPLPMTRVIQKTLQLHGAHPYLMQLRIHLKTKS